MEDSYEAIRRLFIAINKIDGSYYFSSKHLGINENTLALLYALDDGGSHSQKQICEEWLIPKTTINTIVKELIADGYVTLVSGVRKREKIIRLTPEGQAYTKHLMKNFYRAEQEALKETLKLFSPDFIKAMEYFSTQLEKAFQTNILNDK